MTHIKYTDVMMDIETLGTTPGCMISSIGLVAFNPVYGVVGDSVHLRIDLKSCEKLGMTLSTDTILWWMKQSEEARSETFFAGDRITIGEALFRVQQFIQRGTVERVWAQGPQFDHVIMEKAYDLVKKPVPWHYRWPRDTRTVYDLAGINVKDFMKGGTVHNAEDDALCQTYALIAAYQKLELNKDLEHEITTPIAANNVVAAWEEPQS